ncbi:HpcH/HpaI aldolase/citrate lyase family protein [Bradyrhizobium tunisiense]|uniref:HpcH/HpaI aldolase/citrate lyase family protein n=1 Tax=Bradyrhizobium tunisiense TaxID=3278709 RepID=UPI0035D612EE
MDLFLGFNPAARVSRFAFRAQQPLFANRPLRLHGRPSDDGADSGRQIRRLYGYDSEDLRMTRTRSWLFTPGSRPERFGKALASAADVIILDLEDSVALARKDDARESVFGFLHGQPDTKRIAVRINPLNTRYGLLDLLAASDSKPAWVILPKVESATQVGQIRNLIPETGVVALIESARGLLNAAEIAQGGANLLMFGAADYSSEHGIDPSWQTLLAARARMIEAAVLAGIRAIDSPFFSVSDLGALIDEARAARASGFSAKAAIHPGQIEAINNAFSPTEQETCWARTVISESANGVAVVDGKMVDGAMARRAMRILDETI